MELAAQSHIRGIALRARWVPRLQNEEADALSNFEFASFDMAKRIEVDLGSLDFLLLNELFSAGDEYISELDEIKKKEQERAKAANTQPGVAKKKRRKGQALRDTNPW